MRFPVLGPGNKPGEVSIEADPDDPGALKVTIGDVWALLPRFLFSQEVNYETRQAAKRGGARYSRSTFNDEPPHAA